MANRIQSENLVDELKLGISDENIEAIETSLSRLAAGLAAEHGSVATGKIFRHALDKIYVGQPDKLINEVESSSRLVRTGRMSITLEGE